MNAKEYREFCAEAQAIALQGYHGYSRRKLPENGREVLMSYDTLDKTFLVIETAFETLEHANPDAYIWGVSRWSGDWKASVTVGEKLQLRHALEAAGRVPKPRKDRFGDGFSDYHQSWFSMALADAADAEAPSKIDAVARECGMYDRIYSEGFAVQDNGEGPGEFDDPGVHFRKAAEDGSSHWRIGSIEQKIVFPHPSFPHWYVERVDDTSGYRVGVYNLTLDAALLYEAVPAPSPDQEYPVSSFVSWEEFENAEDKSAAPDIG